MQHDRDMVVGTDGSQSSDRAVRQAARAAFDRGSTLHVVCRLARMTNCAERKLARELPADIAWTAGRGAQQEGACSEALETAEHAAPGVDVRLHVSYSRLNSAVQAIAVAFDAEVFGLSAGAQRAGRFSRTRRLLGDGDSLATTNPDPDRPGGAFKAV